MSFKAQPKTWDGEASTNNWGDASNWNPDGVPASSDDVELTGANTININTGGVCSDITLNNASLTLTVKSGNSLTVSNNLTLTTGTLNTEASFPTVSGTTTISGGTVGYTASSGSQTVAVKSYVNLSMNGGGTKTLAGTITPSGNLAVSAGTFDLSTYTCNRASSGGTLTVSNGATLKIDGTNGFPSNYTTNTLGATSTVEYAGTNQTVGSQSYRHLTLSGSGTKTMPGSALSIAGNFTTSGTLSATAASAFTVGGNVSIGSGTTFNGGGPQTVAAMSYYNLTLSNAGTKTIASGTTGIANTFTIGGSASANATTNSATIDYNGSGAQTITNISYHHLTLSTGGTKTPAAGLPIAGDFTIGSGATFAAGALAHTVQGSFSRSGMFTAGASTIQFTGSSDVSITGATTFSTLVVNKSAITTTVTLNNNVMTSTLTMTQGRQARRTRSRSVSNADVQLRRNAANIGDGDNDAQLTRSKHVHGADYSLWTIANMVLTLNANATNPIPGQQVTYTISYSNTGDGTSTNTLVTAAAPVNTTYLSSSTTINSVAKTDAADAEEVTVSGSTISISLGTVAASGSGTITYMVAVN